MAAHRLAWGDAASIQEFEMEHHLPKGHALYQAGQTGHVWQIQRGLMWLSADQGQALTWLALPGDMLGVETLCGEAYACTAVALKGTTLARLSVDTQWGQFSVVAQGYLQQQQRLRDMARLRSGTVGARMSHLLRMLALEFDGGERVLQRHELPTLREMAQLIDAKPETVCRELARWFPAREDPRHKTAMERIHNAALGAAV